MRSSDSEMNTRKLKLDRMWPALPCKNAYVSTRHTSPRSTIASDARSIRSYIQSPAHR